MFTVIDILRGMGVSAMAPITWAAGTAARDAYVAKYGALPTKALRRKTTGPGSHCFAVYPEDERECITAAVRDVLNEINAVAEAQGRLF